MSAGQDWSPAEIVAVVTDYLTMLRAELAGLEYSKAAHRRDLLGRLRPGRTEASVEFKHCNVSAVMLELGLPYVKGYRPRGNYQEALAAEVRRRLQVDGLLRALNEFDGHPVTRSLVLKEAAIKSSGERPRRRGRVVDYEALQAECRKLGVLGEELVLDFERTRLSQEGRPDLASAVRWVAREDGDGLGYDVLSFDLNGLDRHIEVKTTALGPETPFYLSSSELAFADAHTESFVLYRLYDVYVAPAFFTVAGDLNWHLDLTPVTFRARLSRSN